MATHEAMTNVKNPFQKFTVETNSYKIVSPTACHCHDPARGPPPNQNPAPATATKFGVETPRPRAMAGIRVAARNQRLRQRRNAGTSRHAFDGAIFCDRR